MKLAVAEHCRCDNAHMASPSDQDSWSSSRQEHPFSCLARCIQTTLLAKSHARARRGAGRESLQATTSLRGGELTRSSTHRPRLWTRVQSKWYCQGAPGFAAAAPDPRKAWELRRAASSAAWRSECFGKVCSATPQALRGARQLSPQGLIVAEMAAPQALRHARRAGGVGTCTGPATWRQRQRTYGDFRMQSRTSCVFARAHPGREGRG